MENKIENNERVSRFLSDYFFGTEIREHYVQKKKFIREFCDNKEIRRKLYLANFSSFMNGTFLKFVANAGDLYSVVLSFVNKDPSYLLFIPILETSRGTSHFLTKRINKKSDYRDMERIKREEREKSEEYGRGLEDSFS